MSFAAETLACVRGERMVFRDLSFAIEPGGALLLQGPNGSGKSSLLRLCAGFLSAAHGRLLWNGADVAADVEGWRERFLYVGHHDAIKPAFTVRRNLEFWAALGGGEVNAALARFDLVGLADVPGRYLSAGQRRRANLARLALRPVPLWLLDEPTTALDKSAVALLAAAVAAHRSAGGMVLAATHLDLGLADVAVLELAR